VIFLRIPADLAYREVVTRTVATACKIAGERQRHGPADAEELVAELVSAAGEAFNNTGRHAYAGRAGTVEIAIEVRDGIFEIALSDEGETFDPATVPAPDLAALPESGMGLHIIRSFVDELSYTPGPPNVLRMRRRL